MVTDPILSLIEFYQQLLVVEVIVHAFKTSYGLFDECIEVRPVTKVKAGDIP